MLVTPIGERIVEQSQSVLDELEMLGSIARGVEHPLVGPFRLGIVPSLAPYLLPTIIEPLHEAYPNLELIPREGNMVELIESLKKGRLEAIIGPSALPSGSGKVMDVKLFDEPLVCAIHKQHKIAKLKRLTPSSLSVPDLVLLDEPNSLTSQTMELISDTTSITDHPIYTSSIPSMCVVVSLSKKVAIVPRLAAIHERNFDDITFREFTSRAPSRSISLIWRSRYRGAESLKLFVPKLSKIIRERYQGMLS